MMEEPFFVESNGQPFLRKYRLFESPCQFVNRQQFWQEAWRVLRLGGRFAEEDWLAADE
jgi:hypothetical protein